MQIGYESFELDRETIDDTLCNVVESIAYDHGTDIDDKTFNRIIDKALDVAGNPISYRNNYYLRSELDNLVEAWSSFLNALVRYASDEVLENDED